MKRRLCGAAVRRVHHRRPHVGYYGAPVIVIATNDECAHARRPGPGPVSRQAGGSDEGRPWLPLTGQLCGNVPGVSDRLADSIQISERNGTERTEHPPRPCPRLTDPTPGSHVNCQLSTVSCVIRPRFARLYTSSGFLRLRFSSFSSPSDLRTAPPLDTTHWRRPQPLRWP
jgi:hypothetical protein